MENRERRVGVGHLSEPRSQSLPKRKRTPSAGGPSHASSSREGVTARGLRDDLEGADSDEKPEEAAADEQPVDGLYSVGLSDTSVLDCPVCFEPLTLPVFQCGNGHVLCSTCIESVKQKCPACSKKIGNIRCRAFESVLESVKVLCPYKSYGCPIELSYSLKRSHEEACAYAPYGCPFNECRFVGCQTRLSLHLNNSHASSVIRLRFDHVCLFSMGRAEQFVVFREEANGTLFILNKYDRMTVSCIGGSNVSAGDRFAYALIVRGKDSCLRFQSLTNRFETTPTGKGVTIGVPSKDFIQVPSYLFDYDGCLRLELCIWRKGAPCVDIARGAVGSSSNMDFGYMEGFDDLEKELVMSGPSCARARPIPPTTGDAGLLHGHAEEVEGGVGDIVATVAPAERTSIVEVGDSPDPPLANLKTKTSRKKKSSRRARDSSPPQDSVGRLLGNIVKDGREALSILGKVASQAADVEALRKQVTRTELELKQAKTERDAALLELDPLKKEKYAALLELSALKREKDAASLELENLKKERDAALSQVSSLRTELPLACKKAHEEGRQGGVDEYVAGYRMKARYAHYAAPDFFYGLKVGARQVLNHYNLEPIRLNPRDNAGEEYLPKRPYKPPAIGLIKGDYEGVLEAWGVTELIDDDPFIKKPHSPATTSAGLKRTRDGALRGDASSTPVSKP